jgi:hypothetical protein
MCSKPEIAKVAKLLNVIESVTTNGDCNHPDSSPMPVTINAYEADE